MIEGLENIISSLKEFVVIRAKDVWGVGDVEVEALVDAGTRACMKVIETTYNNVVVENKEYIAQAATLRSLFYSLCAPFADYRDDEYLNYYAFLEGAEEGIFINEDVCAVQEFLHEYYFNK